MKKEYLDRSRIVFRELENEEMRIDVLNYQTRQAVDEATAKNLVSQYKLHKALEKAEPNGSCYNKIVKALVSLTTNWEELNSLKKDTF